MLSERSADEPRIFCSMGSVRDWPPQMKETLKVLNGMLKAGVVQRYAIGGAVAAIYYLEPIDTVDLDIFVRLEVSGSELSILTPIYEHLIQNEYRFKG